MAMEVVTEKLNLEEVGRYFENKGYKVQKLEQAWRHVTGVVKYENEKLFLKLACTPGIGERTKNEAGWNVRANSTWKKYVNSFISPKIFDDGIYEGKFWYVGSYVFGKPLIEVTAKNTDIKENDLDQAAKIAVNIMEIGEECLLPKDIEHLKVMWRERIVAMAKQWSKVVKVDTKNLLKYIETNNDKMEISSSHGDFTPWHILKSKEGKYYLIDGEAAILGGLKFYDVAYFYHRVYSKLKRPDLANKFLEKFKNIYGWKESDSDVFGVVLASRIMGGYFDAERDRVTSMELNKEMERKLLDGRY